MFKRLIFVCIFFSFSNAFALDLELTQGVNTAYPIGIESFGNYKVAKDLQSVVTHDLEFSGQFKLITQPHVSDSSQLTTELWRYAGADSVLSCAVESIGNNRFSAKFELINAASRGRLLLSKSYQASNNEIRSLAHKISDDVYESLTGVRGIFSTRIAYILVQNKNNTNRHSLEVADVDGFNPQSLIVSSEPIMSPSWSPDGKQLAYVSFEKKRSQIYTIEVATGRRRLITAFNGINGAPAWSPNGQELAVALSKSGSLNIYTVNLSSGNVKQLTFGHEIDTEPSYSADGKYILFTSGRGGSPQIYRLTLADGSVSRISYDGNYNARASYTPNEKQVVMSHRDEDKRFVIAIQNIGSNQLSILTNSSLDESPSIAPNGKLVLYATSINHKGVLGIVSTDARIKLRLPSPEGDAQEPAWSPYLIN